MRRKGLLFQFFILIIIQDSLQQFTVSDKNKHCEIFNLSKVAVCDGENSDDLYFPTRRSGSNDWKRLAAKNYSAVSVRLSSIQVDGLSVIDSKSVHCLVDTAQTKSVRLERIENSLLEWHKDGARSDRLNALVKDSPKMSVTNSPSVWLYKWPGDYLAIQVELLSVDGVGSLNLSGIRSFKSGEFNISNSQIIVDEFVNGGLKIISNDFYLENSIVEILNSQSILVIDSKRIVLKNSTFKAPSKQVSFSSSAMFVTMFVRDSFYKSTEGTLDIIASSAQNMSSVRFLNNIFSNYSVNILNKATKSWIFKGNKFTCSCYLSNVIDETTFDEEFYENNLCYTSTCKISLRDFFDFIKSNITCPSTQIDFGKICLNYTDDEPPVVLCGKIRSYSPTFAASIVMVSIVLVLCSKRCNKMSTSGPHHQAKNTYKDLRPDVACTIPVTKSEGIIGTENNFDIHNDHSTVYYSPVAECCFDCNACNSDVHANVEKSDTLNCANLVADSSHIYSEITENGYSNVNETKHENSVRYRDYKRVEGLNLTDAYSKVFDSVEKQNEDYEESETQIYTDVSDVVYSVVVKSKKKERMQQNSALESYKPAPNGTNDSSNKKVMNKEDGETWYDA